MIIEEISTIINILFLIPSLSIKIKNNTTKTMHNSDDKIISGLCKLYICKYSAIVILLFVSIVSFIH